MIPWIASSYLQLGPIAIQTWGFFVALCFFVATFIAARRARSRGLDASLIWDFAVWMFAAAMIGARLFHVLFYDFGHYLQVPWDALDPRAPGFSIMGGFLAGAAVFFWKASHRGLDVLAYADVFAWGIPWGCGIGRIGCFLIHDHPGTLTSFILGVRYPDGTTRHDLGLYLSMLGFCIGAVFLALNRTPRSPGFWLGSFLIIDGIARFFLDFLRVVDRRIFGLTPTQWLLFGTVAVGFWLVFLRRPSYTSSSSV